MKYLIYIFLVIATFTNADRCDKMEEKVDGKVELGEVFEIELEKTVKIKGADFGIRYSEVAESRCPTNVNCIVAGEAVASLDVISDEGAQKLKLKVDAYCQKDDGSCGESANSMGYKVQLLNVYPYPDSDDEGPKRVKLKVEKI